MAGDEYPQIHDGDILRVKPGKEKLILKCCDCALVHDLNFTIEKDGTLAIKITINHRETQKERGKLHGRDK